MASWRPARLVFAALVFALLAAPAQALQAMADRELASVNARDGLAFNLSGFSLSGPLTLTYTSPNGSSLSLANLSLSRSDDPTATFSDPYTLKLVSRSGLADLIQLTEPANASSLLKWQFSTTLSTASTDSTGTTTTFQAGTLQITDLVSRGGSLALTTPATTGVDGIAFGIGLQWDIGSVRLLPRGTTDTTESFTVSGLHLGAADSSGNLLGTPWMLADATNQPGILNAQTDANGISYLHLGIGWPTTTAGAPIASLTIGDVAFASSALPGGQMDLGTSRIGTMQIQYMDIKLRAGQ